ncbi:polyketide synthase PksG [Stemphylium lycopersici]|nr:polyketide synthase PksG [Stemphylium lycopersici]
MATDKTTPIAIIGMNMKFPGDAVSAESFWELVMQAKNVSKEIPQDRFNIDAFYHPDPARLDSLRIRHAHFMTEDPRSFDAPFFNMSYAEASVLDPQQRGLLEGAYRTFENAGIPLETLSRSPTSVYCASFSRDGETITGRDFSAQSRYHATANGSSMLSNRISHFFDLAGPSLTVDTACSSGLYALHLGAQSIVTGESAMSLVCGANTFITPESQALALSNGGFLSVDGKSYSFDEKANGYARGEGFGFVLLKPLDAALRDGDVVRAVIRATGANQDGRTPSITQPSQQAQLDLLRDTYRVAGLNVADTDYMEAHGTGTPVGDPIEAAAVGLAFRDGRKADRPLYMGSVKANIGHLEGASGMAVLALENAVIPPIAMFEKANPAIDVAGLQLAFPKEAVPWPATDVRRASVSSFGYGGSNAHVILDDAYNYLRTHGLEGLHKSVGERPATNGHSNGHTNGNGALSTTPYAIIPFSAADSDGTKRQASALQTFLSSHSSPATANFLSDLTYTLSSHRSQLQFRSFAVISSPSDDLTDLVSPSTFSSTHSAPDLSFVFTGQGAQYARMATGLLHYPVFRQSLEDCDVHLKSLGCTWSVLEELERDQEASKVAEPALSQPLCTAIQIALVDLLRAWEIAPRAVVGHSSGEVAAAYCAGGLDRESAWRVAYFRGVVADKLASDAAREATTMMSVGLGKEDVQTYLKAEPTVTIACENSPVNVTVSGPTAAILRLFETLDAAEVFARKLPVKIGYHSEALRDGAVEYENLLAGICAPVKDSKEPSTVAFFSSTEGSLITLEGLAIPSYWVKNLLSPVLFTDAVTALVSERKQTTKFFVEIGPQSALRRPVKDILKHIGESEDKWSYAAMLSPRQPDIRSLLETLGALWSASLPIDLNLPNQATLKPTTPPKRVTDLPAYPFSRAKLYWDEPRISSLYSKRPFRRHALLGLRENDFNPAQPTWHHKIRLAEAPWIVDHALEGSPLYPGTGMLVMAIEAARQLLPPNAAISGYKLENVRFMRSIPVNETEKGTEAKIYLQPRRHTAKDAAQGVYDWRVFTLGGEEWIECAYGSIRVELEEAEVLPETAARKARWANAVSEEHASAAGQCTLSVQSAQLYENLSKKSGFDYGPYFQGLRNIKYSRNGCASGTLALRDYAKNMPYAAEDPCVIHPTTFDSVFHVGFVSLSMGGWEAIPTLMFSNLKELWVSHKLFTVPGNPLLNVATKEVARTFREFEWDASTLLAETGEPVIVAKGERGTVIAGAGSNSRDDDGASRFSYGIDFKPDLSLLGKAETETYLKELFALDPQFSPDPKDAEAVDRADAIALYFIEQALDKIENGEPLEFDNHLTKYVDFLRKVRANRGKYTLASRGLGHLSIEDVLREADDEPTQKLVKKAGEHLYGILAGTDNALQIIFEGNLANDFYHCDFYARHYRKAGAYMSILAHANPQLRICEVGSGTGSATSKVLPFLVDSEGLQADQMVRFGEYAYTDVSVGFFEKAREKFAFAEKHMRFAKLDLEICPSLQGFELGSYDVIMACNVIHTTSDLMKCLRDLLALLRPGGKLIMMETTVDNIRDGIIFGLLPGWWMREGHWWDGEDVDAIPGEDEALGPILTEDGWDAALKTAGFSGVDMVFRDNEYKPRHRVSTLVTTRPEEVEVEATRENWVILADEAQAAYADALKAKLGAVSWIGETETYTLGDLVAAGLQLSSTNVISLLELDTSLFGTIADPEFEALKKISLDAKTVLWLTRGGSPGASNPAAEMAVGFSRSICSERGDQAFVTLSLETVDPNDGASHVLSLLEHFHKIGGGKSADAESEYAVHNGLIHIPRIVPQKSVNQTLAARARLPDKLNFTLGQAAPKPRINLTIQQPGLLDTLYYTETPTPSTELQHGQVEIEVAAASLNFRDVMISLGQVPGDGLGLEGSGTVTSVGPGCTMLKPGDRVMYFIFSTGGCCGTYVRCDEGSTRKIPRDDISFLDAAAIPAVWATVVYAFDYVGRLRKGESVLIHAGAGAVGQAAIQLAQLRGADVFVTVGSEWKRELVKGLYGLADDHIFHSREASFVDDVFHATANRGVDVVLNSLGGELLQHSWRCTAPFGRFIDIGKADILANNTLEMGHFLRNVTFAAVDVAGMYAENKPLMQLVLDDVFSLFAAHPELHNPKPLHAFAPSKVEEAMRALQGGRIAGKAVIDFEKSGDVVTYQPAQTPAYGFEAQATYVISGGLGGLGREIMRWMASRGARHFLVTSSRGVAGRADVIAFIKEMEAQDVVIHAPASDISNRAVLKATLEEASKTLPPIRGCIQAAMVLSDNMLSNMTVSQFHRALAPKYQGSWNLHELLPKDMDFMVFLSSMSGIIGNPAQANYAAGNTFEDALARHRAASGLKGVSFDLGLVLEAGWASDNFEDVTKSLRAGLGGLTQKQLMAILDVLCDPQYDCAGGAAQVVNIHDKPSKLYRMFQDGVLHWVGKPLFRNLLRLGQVELVNGTGGGSEGEATAVDYLALIKAAADAKEAGQIVTLALLGKLSKSLSMPAENLDVGKPAYVLGVDSLIAVELRYWFLKQFGVEVPVFVILKKQPTVDLCQHVADQLPRLSSKLSSTAASRNHRSFTANSSQQPLDMAQNYQQYGGNPYGQAEEGYGAQANPYGGGGGYGSSNPYGGGQLNPPAPLQRHGDSNYSQPSQYSQAGALSPSNTHTQNVPHTDVPMNNMAAQGMEAPGARPLSREDFFARIEGAKQRIGQLTADIQAIASVHQRMLASPDNRSTAELESIVTNTQIRNTQIKDEIKFLERDVLRDGNNPTKKTQVDALKRTFKSQLEDFQREEADYSKRYREAVGRQYRIINPDATDAEVDEIANADLGDEGIFTQALKSNRSGQASSVLGAVRARHNDIQRIEKTMTELALLFTQLNEQVVYQEASVQQTEQQTVQVKEDTENANKQLDEGIKSARRARKLKWWILLTVLAIIAILALVLGLYFGLNNKK